MKWKFGLAVLFWACSGVLAFAQPPAGHDLTAQRAAMRKLAFLIGSWSGSVRMTQPGGTVVLSRSEDEITLAAGDAVLAIHGRRFAPGAARDAAPIGANLGLVNYDDQTGRYEIRSFSQGAFSQGAVDSVEPGHARWSLPSAGGPVRFDIRADGPDAWIERIERSTDGGQSWSPLMEIRFTRKPDSPASQ